jgi:hypothetical protein
LGHLASRCPERKKKKKEPEGPKTTATPTMEDFDSQYDIEHVIIYREGVDPVELQLIGNRVERLYMLRGQPSVYDSTSDEEHEEALETTMAPRIQYFISIEDSESLLSTGRRLSQCDQTNAQDEVDSPRSSGFQIVARRISSSSSYVQVLRMAPGSKGAPTKPSVMELDDSDGSDYFPH